MAKDELAKIETAQDLINNLSANQPIAKKQKFFVSILDDSELKKNQEDDANGYPPLIKSVLNVLNEGSIQRLSFTVDPIANTNYGNIYRPKLRLIPDNILKRIAIQDDLVASIILLKCNQLTAFAVPRRDRFGTGYVIEPNTGVIEGMTQEQKDDFDKRIQAAIVKLNNCGETKGWQDTERCSLATWMRLSVRNALTVGRIATEVLWVTDPTTNKKKFHSFRAIDAGTIYQATPQKSALQTVRDSAFKQLQDLVGTHKKLIPEKYHNDEYKWVQVIDNTPREVFTADECVVHNFYPVLDVDLDGYPVTPIDTMVSAVTTHINITTHNKLYFQNGRAAKGMIVINSEEVDQNVLNSIRQQFNAAINNVNNCLDGSTSILTKEFGGSSIVDYLNGASERKATVWTPFGWQPGLVYKTGLKQLSETHLSNGVVLKTSPDHRIRTINEFGEQIWKRQDEFKVGDFVMVDKSQGLGINISDLGSLITVGFEQVVDIKHTYQNVEMYDVAVYEPTHNCLGLDCKSEYHAFFANFVHCANSHRTPVLGLPTDDKLQWVPMDSARDMEFQYLTDMNARVIMTAFQVSPDELPGWAYLSRGTNSQSLSESNIEFKLTAARDLGLRPFIAHFEDFFNAVIFPLIDEPLSKLAKIRFMGLEADNPEKEAIRLQQNIPINLTYNDVMIKTEKPIIDKAYGGDFPLNPQYQAVLNAYNTVGEIKEYFFGVKGAAKDPNLQYYRDNFWFQWIQLQQQAQQMQMQAQQPQPPPGSDGGSGGPAGSTGSDDPNKTAEGQTKDGRVDSQGANGEGGKNNGPGGTDPSMQPQTNTEDLTRSIGQALDLLSKSEDKLPVSKRKQLAQQRMTIHNFVRGLQDDLKQANKEVLDLINGHVKN